MKFAYLFIIFMMASCFDAATNQVRDFDNSGVTPTPPVTNNPETPEVIKTIPKVEIRHLVQPKLDQNSTSGGEYKRKLTIPKNYEGLLHIAGINVATLSDKNVIARFHFGTQGGIKDIQTTIATASGLTPQSDVAVLTLDLRSRPFRDINLIYKLFDYNKYDFTGTGNDPGALTEPVSSNLDDNLFCRGLKLEDDSTFTGDITQGCNEAGDVCKYSFASIIDRGLVNKLTGDPIIPTEPQIQSGDAYYTDTDAIKLQRCLPTNPFQAGGAYIYDLTQSFATFGSERVIDGISYIYKGPYLPLNTDEWQINNKALKGTFGVFEGLDDTNANGVYDADEIDAGYRSKLFPIYTSFPDRLKDTEYLGSDVPDGTKVLKKTNSTSDTLWMDGCSRRATSTNIFSNNENIGSCTVTGKIELIATDGDGKVTTIDITKQVKLQLVTDTPLNTTTNDNELDSFGKCSSSSQCGGDECCVNERCWSKSIVNQCIEDLPNFGNLDPGKTCSSDYQCASLCCNQNNQRCAPHDTNSSNKAFCSKPAGQTCVAKEWCQKYPVETCAPTLTGRDVFGAPTCALRCVRVEQFGECTSFDSITQGICIEPIQPAVPAFDPANPNRCNNAVTPQRLEECAQNNISPCTP